MRPGESGSSRDYNDMASNSKGKGKAAEAAPQSQGESLGNDRPRTDNSVATRVLDSSISLTKDLARSIPGSSDMNYMLPADKAGRSSGSTVPLGLAETGTRRAAGRTDPGAAFKSAHVEDHVASQEAAFSAFLDGENSQPSSFPAAYQDSIRDTLVNTSSTVETPSAAEHAQRDGMDVVKLLESTDYNSVAEPDEAGVTLPLDEAAALRRALFPDQDSKNPKHHDIDWNILNFFPNFITDSSPRWGYTELPNHMGVTDPIEARDLWVNQWQNVLSGYTDEIWGDLGSLVDEARQEVEEASARDPDAVGPPEMPALRRLRQVLNHIRGGR
ncbi:hypothetical protein PG999_013439 [Apiospora kogelbergensis]|uniref:Uncharacterized protein n=1 Tax=Apiospora kogelbergensis TaxID=1337665 RepID=A0AAW0Q7N4_9PEZI